MAIWANGTLTLEPVFRDAAEFGGREHVVGFAWYCGVTPFSIGVVRITPRSGEPVVWAGEEVSAAAVQRRAIAMFDAAVSEARSKLPA